MEELHICKYCGVETTQPDEECYAKPAKERTAVEWLEIQFEEGHSYINEIFEREFKQAKEMEKQQKEKTVLDILNHVLGHDYTARWLAEKIESGKINVNDL